MIKKALLEEVLAKAMSTGADFAEVFAENTHSNSIYMVDGKVDSVSDGTVSGVGIRAFMGTNCVSASTIDLSREGLLRCASQVADIIGDKPTVCDINLRGMIFPDVHAIKYIPDTAKKSYKTDILKAGYFAAKDR